MSIRVWIFNAILCSVAIAVFYLAVTRLPQTWGAVHVPVLLLAASFCAAESWRVYIHFQRNAQSYGLSEIPIIVGLFFATPNELVLARVIGAAIGLTLIRRHTLIKLIFNLATFVLELDLVTLFFNAVVPDHNITSPLTWLAVLLIIGTGSFFGFLLSAVVITLAEGSIKRNDWLQPAGLVVVGGMANASLGLEVVAAVSRQPSEVLLLVLPIVTLSASYGLYTRANRKNQELRHLYQASDLLQRATNRQSAIPELLGQLCQVFRAEMAEIILLPVATGADHAVTIAMRRGVCTDDEHVVDLDLLESFAPLMNEAHASLIETSPSGDTTIDKWLQQHGVRNAMTTTLQGDGVLLGAMVVGNRLSDVSSFDAGDLSLFETFAAQASVAVQNTRLDHRLKHQAFHDPLTGLANRALFADRLEHAMTRRDQYSEPLAVIFLDLDDFKMINDSLGHSAGDELLRSVAGRLQTVLRPSDTAARFGGDEFAVLLEETAEAYNVVGVAERIVAALRPHFTVASHEVAVHASVGVASTSTRNVGPDELLRRADVAMYRAKMRGKGVFEVFDPGIQEVVNRRLQVKTDLEHAIERRELAMHYQPIVDIASGSPLGVEALIRWNHPRWGLVMPGDFIGVAEETGLINDIGLFALREACRQCQDWQTAFPDQAAFTVSVNVSPRQLRRAGFVDSVWGVLAETGLHPSRLVLEITESYMVEDAHNAGERLRALKALGVRLSMDDFGTGYSSLAALQDLPLDILKIDKAFVDQIVDDPRRAAFAQAIIRLGKTLGLHLIAEGVETQAQADRLRALGCTAAQGYYFSRPKEPAEIEHMLRATVTSERGIAHFDEEELDSPALVVLPADPDDRHAGEPGVPDVQRTRRVSDRRRYG